MNRKILVHHPPVNSDHPSYRAHLEETQHEHMAASLDEAVTGLLSYLSRLGWSGDRGDYDVVDASEHLTSLSRDFKPPIYVHHEDGAGSRWVAEPSGAPHLCGYGPTAEEALANCQSTLEFHGFANSFGDPIYC